MKNGLKIIQKNKYHKPHLFSSIKHNGTNLYKFARLDIKMKVKKKENKIDKIKLIKNNEKILIITVICKHGIYIRSIINELSECIKTPICTLKITRLSIKKYTILNSYNYKDIIKNKKVN